MTAVVGQTRAALANAAGEARAGWRDIHTALLVLFVLACAVPWIAPGWVHVDELAAWLYLALSATGLVAAVGLAGLPSLAQGAFMTIGALTTGLLAARGGWPVEATVPVAVLASLVGGLVSGLAVVRLDPLFLAVGTWILAWLVYLGALAFPGISGGSQGYVVDSSLSTTGHYELGLVLTAIAVVAVATLRRSAVGIRLRAVRDRPAAATSLGVRGDRLLLGAFVTAAGVGGLAGSLSVQLAGVTDPGAFGPVVSFKLLAAVLLGGASYAVSGIVGVAVLGGIALLARLWAHLQAGSAAEVEPMFAAILLLVVLALRPEGAPLLGAAPRPARPGRPPRARASVVPGVRSGRSRRPLRPGAGEALRRRPRPRRLRSRDRPRRDRRPRGRERVREDNGPPCAGRRPADRRRRDRARRQVGRGPRSGGARVGRRGQDLAANGHVRHPDRAGERRGRGFAARQAERGVPGARVDTQGGRAEARELNAAALDALRTVRLERLAGVAAERLDGFQQRRLMLAAALAARPRLLLLDEPSAGAARTEVDGLLEILASIRESGVSLLVVEHDQRLVRALADRVVVMADGKALPG